MTKGSTSKTTKDFNIFFDELWKNRHYSITSPLKHLKEDINFIQNYYKNSNNYYMSFSTKRLLEPDFFSEINDLINNGFKVDKENGTVEFPIKYIKDNITEGEISALKTHFKEVESNLSNTPLYIEHKNLFKKFKEEYHLY